MNFKKLEYPIAAALAVLLLPSISGAKIFFTGYGNFQMSAQQSSKIYGDPAALATFKLTDSSVKTRGFTMDSLGFFATTNIKEEMNFLLDLTYRKIGNTTGETRIQYAYLEDIPWEDFRYRLGKITLPFGYYNQNRFYAFQREELSSPVFQSAILGLPIADVGASIQKRYQTRAARIDVDLYGVNGYGGTPSDPKKFRSATLPGALVLSGNLASSNGNGNIAFGGRLRFAEIAGRQLESGVSYYGGAWDSGGSKYFQMMNVHFHSKVARLDFLAEYLHMDVLGDAGFAASVGDEHWMTDGYFMTMSYPLWQIRDMPLTPFLTSEGYVSRGKHSGGGQERLQSYHAGLCLKPLEAVRVKMEYGFLKYGLPLVGMGDLKLDIHNVLLSLSLAF